MTEQATEAAPHLPHGHHTEHLLKEALTMALYVALCLLAALTVVSHHPSELTVMGIVWGTTIGLALAHWFAFGLSARFVSSGQLHDLDAATGVAQLVGAAGVAIVATLAAIVMPESAELDAVRVVLAAFVTLVGVAVARSTGASRGRSIVFGLIVLVAAAVVVLVKNVLAGH